MTSANHTAAVPDPTGAAACQAKPANLPRPKPVSVNGVVISRAAIARETQNHPASKPIDAWLAAARALVVRELLLQEARRLAIEPSPLADADGRRETDEEAIIRQLVEIEVVIPAPDEAACRRIYDSQRARFRSADIYAVRHILFAAAPADEAARRDARGRAIAAIETLRSEPERFAAIARACSACPSRDQGGNLGQVSHGQTVPEFERALAEAPVGHVAPKPVETRYGCHVVAVDQRFDGRELPFDLVKESIAQWLVASATHAAQRQYIALLASRANISGISLDGPASSLAQ